jgi:undecaprenyl-phosphate 4-deoxy-4-formamido-L-arabinose transferase
MASCTGDWVVTMDEDGQQNPRDIAKMLDMAIADNLQIVYANPENKPPHGFLRNLASKFAKKIAVALLGGNYDIDSFNSYRLIDGEIARILAAYCGDGVYLDIGLFWTATRIGYCPVLLRHEERNSSYTYSMLLAHFWRMVLSSGTRPLRLITYLGFFSLLLALIFILYALFSKYIERTPVSGWTSLLVITSFFSGLIMVSMGVIAEYLALMMGISMGKPLYIIASKPTRPKGK